MHPKLIIILNNRKLKTDLKIEDDNPRQFDRVDVDLLMSKMPSLIGPEMQCLSSLTTYSISDSWAHTTFIRFRTLLS